MRETVHIYRNIEDGEVVWSFQATTHDAKLYAISVPDGFYAGRDDFGRSAIFRNGSTRPAGIRDATMADKRARVKFVDSKGHVLVDARAIM